MGENGELVVANPVKQGKDGHRLFKFNKVFSPEATQGHNLLQFEITWLFYFYLIIALATSGAYDFELFILCLWQRRYS